MNASPSRRVEVTAAEFVELFRSVSSWGRWGERDEQRSTELTSSPERVAAATRLVRDGMTVSLSLPLNTIPAVYP